MSRRAKRNNKGGGRATAPARLLDPSLGAQDQTGDGLPRDYWQACRLAEQGQYDEARQLYSKLVRSADGGPLGALVRNDLAVLATLEGRYDEARQGWEEALELDQGCLMARLNRDLVQAELDVVNHDEGQELKLVLPGAPAQQKPPTGGPIKVAILSFLFNWPRTSGGNMHTAGLVDFLTRAGYEVRHFYARFPDWGIGRVSEPLLASEAIEFDANGWSVAEIQARYRRAVDSFRPDYVAITDTWNMKPLLAEAMRGYPCLLLYQAQENLCPLNNLRLLADGPNQVRQCPRNQLATPGVCHRCLAERGHHSGALHQCERAVAGVGTPEYDQKLHRSLQEAEAVLVLNPQTATMLEPYASRVCIVPWGLDPARFPWPPPDEPPSRAPGQAATLFMAAVAGETIKGFHVAREACRLLRQTRTDFDLVVTFDPPGPGRIDEFTRSVGWCSQAELPRYYRAADIVLVPTIAQDGLSITSVEAMASGIPVVASRIGGAPYTVSDGVTGLLFEPGDAADMARQIARLLDDPALRQQMGLAGRQRFEADFTWPTVIERHWRPLLPRKIQNQLSHG
jgi:glycosyltransferase involved in cell wall biosynthesis